MPLPPHPLPDDERAELARRAERTETFRVLLHAAFTTLYERLTRRLGDPEPMYMTEVLAMGEPEELDPETDTLLVSERDIRLLRAAIERAIQTI